MHSGRVPATMATRFLVGIGVGLTVDGAILGNGKYQPKWWAATMAIVVCLRQMSEYGNSRKITDAHFLSFNFFVRWKIGQKMEGQKMDLRLKRMKVCIF